MGNPVTGIGAADSTMLNDQFNITKPEADFEVEYIDADNEQESSSDEAISLDIDKLSVQKKKSIFNMSQLAASNLTQNHDNLSSLGDNIVNQDKTPKKDYFLGSYVNSPSSRHAQKKKGSSVSFRFK